MKLKTILINMVVEMDLQLLNIEWNKIVKAKLIKEPLFVNLVEYISLKKCRSSIKRNTMEHQDKKNQIVHGI